MKHLRNPDLDGSHPVHIGKIYSDTFIVKEATENYNIVHLECIMNVHGKNVYYLIADFRMYLVEYWDGLVFSLFRNYYGLPYPTLLGADYVINDKFSYPVIFKKEEEETTITYNDWRKKNGINFKTRFHLAVLVYLCRFLGVPLSMNMIKIKNRIPYFWEARIIGLKNAPTLKREELLEIFDIHPTDWTLLMEGKPTSFMRCSNMIALSYEGHMELEMKENSMMYLVIQYMRSIDFNLDVIRGFLHLRENEIRYHCTNRQKYPTKIKPRAITTMLEKNYSCLISNSPMDIFTDLRF